MQLFSKREKINRDAFNANFNQNFYYNYRTQDLNIHSDVVKANQLL